jgi:hypothetical protein
MANAFEWDIGVAMLTTYDPDGFVSTQVDAPGENNAQVHSYENHFPYGLYARASDAPLDGNSAPDPTKSHQVLYALEGGQGHSWPMENPSIISLLPTLQPGESLFYGPMGQFVRTTIDGHILMWTPGTGGGPDQSLMFGPDGFSVSGSWGKIQLDENGITLQTAAGARIDLGAAGGIPAPTSAIGTHITMQAGAIDAQCTGFSAGPDTSAGGIAAPLPNGIFLMAWMLSVNAALTAIASTIQAGGVTSMGPAQFPTAAAVVAAVASVIPPTPVTLYTNANGMF